MHANELYMIVDIEADGPIPGPYSMISLGAVMYDADNDSILSQFTVNIKPLPDATIDKETADFWARNPVAYAKTLVNAKEPEAAMWLWNTWMTALERPIVFVGMPASFDFMFAYWYLIKFVGKSPFSHAALDMKTLAMFVLHTTYRRSSKRFWPKEWLQLRHTHYALEDALEQTHSFKQMLKRA